MLFGGENMKKHENHISFYKYKDFEIVSGVCVHFFPIHIHRTLCIGIIRSGYANFVISNQKTILTAGDYYIIPPYTPHSLSPVNNKAFSYSVCCFKGFHAKQNLSDVIADTKEYIEKTPAEFNLTMLSEAIHISKYHLNRKFKEQIGITPYQFYVNERVKKIRQGLLSSSSLSDLAFELGFSDQSHLCNAFKKHMGISPLQYVSSYYNF